MDIALRFSSFFFVCLLGKVYPSNTSGKEEGGRIVSNPVMVELYWNEVLRWLCAINGLVHPPADKVRLKVSIQLGGQDWR